MWGYYYSGHIQITTIIVVRMKYVIYILDAKYVDGLIFT